MRFVYILSESVNPYENLALERTLFPCVEENTAVLFLWQNEHTIVIGKNQLLSAECRMDEFIADGGTIARRRSGGGAVYHDIGNLNFSILCREGLADRCRYQEIVTETLKKFRLSAEFNGRNDLLLDGRKFSGNASYTDGSVLCRHGTILIHTDIGRMSYYLTPEASKLARNHVASVKSRVVNLCELSHEISVDSVRNAMIAVTGAKPLAIPVNHELMKRQLEFYSDKKWIYGGTG